MKKNIFLFIVILLLVAKLDAQPNCNAYPEPICKEACNLAWEADSFPQGSKRSQELLSKSIELCPTFAYSLNEIGVPYLKQGLLKEWKEWVDKAVALEPQTYLVNRAWSQFSYLRNYEAALKDLNRLYELRNTFELGYSGSGEYPLQLIRAICYQKTGDVNKAIEIMEQLTQSKNYSQGLFDYFHIGIAYLEARQLDKAKAAFDKQNEENELAETAYYYANIFNLKNKKNKQEEMLLRAKELYKKERIMKNKYYHYVDKVFKSDIEEALLEFKNK